LKKHKRKHNIKSTQQEEILMAEWEKDPKFTSERIRYLVELTGIDYRTIYKWQWDRNKGYHAQVSMAYKLVKIS
jgi:hypothetical protein